MINPVGGPRKISIAAMRGPGDGMSPLSQMHRAATPSLPQAAAHLSMGMELENEGHYALAVSHYFKALTLEPGEQTALINACNIIFYKAPSFRIPELIDHIENALTIHPEDHTIKNKLGYAYFKTGRYGDARRVFDLLLEDEAVREDAKFFSAVLGNLGFSMCALGHTGKAVELLRRAVELDRENKEARVKLAEIIGRPEFGKFHEAIVVLDALLKEDPNDTKTLSAKASILFENKKFSEAAIVYRRCVALEPRNVKFLKDLAASYTFSGKNLSAARFYLGAVWVSEEREEKQNCFREACNALAGSLFGLFRRSKG